MNIIVRRIIMVMAVLIFSSQVYAAGVVVFLQDGQKYGGNLTDLSSNTGIFDFADGTRLNRNEIWLINYENDKWDFPGERDQISGRGDTVILRNGQVKTGRLIDFSSRLYVYEFQDGSKVQEAAVLRIYLCCNKLPSAFANQLNQGSERGSNRGSNRGENNRGSRSQRNATVFLLDGNYISTPLKYLNNRKTGFTDGLQINTKDIWMINFEDDNWDFADERREIRGNQDTIFTTNGEVFYDTVVSFEENSRQFEFDQSDPVRESKISRIYFCCEKLPAAYRNNQRGRGYKR